MTKNKTKNHQDQTSPYHLDHRTRSLRHPTPHRPPQRMPESAQSRKQHYRKRSRPAHFPKIVLVFCRVGDVFKVHAVVAGEEGEGEEDDGDDGEDHDGFVLRV